MKEIRVVTDGPTQIRDHLLSRRSELLDSLRPELEALATRNDTLEDDLSRAFQDQFLAVQIKRLDFFELKLIESALDCLGSEEGGCCADCGKPISAKRLKAIPWAIRCIACQKAAGSLDS